MTQDDEKEEEEIIKIDFRKWYFIVLFIGIVIGVFAMLLIYNRDDSDSIVNSFENFMLYVPKVRPALINEDTTIGRATDLYFHYGFVSRSMLSMELGKICRTWDKEELENMSSSLSNFNETLNSFCNEVCG